MADSSLKKLTAGEHTPVTYGGKRKPADNFSKDTSSESNIFESFLATIGELGTNLLHLLDGIGVCVMLFFIKLHGRIRSFKKTFLKFGRFLAAEAKDILTPFVKILLTPRLIFRNIRKSNRNPFAVAIDTIGEGIRNNKMYVKSLFNYAMPICAALALTLLISQASKLSYVVAVKYNGETVGYVDSEEDFYTAKSNLEQRIIYQEDEEQIDFAPTFELTIVESENVQNAEELTNTLLAMAGGEIADADGFYVDGEFYAAINNKEEVQQYLNARLAEKQAEYPDDHVEYVNTIEYKSGYYLRENLEETEDIIKLIESEEGGKSKYIAQNEESLSLVAAKKSVAYEELIELNGLTSDSVTSGQELKLPEKVKLLNIQVTREEKHEKTEEYEVIKEDTDELEKGQSEVVQEGQDGIYEITETIIEIDGEEVDRREMEDKTVVKQEKVDKIIKVGTKVTEESKDAVEQFIDSGAGKFIRPLKPGVGYVSSYLGDGRNHQGYDIAASTGTPIYASAAGTVTRSNYGSDGYGNCVVIDHGEGWTSLYAHQSQIAVSVGDYVEQGQLIGYVGSTGNSTGPHLHFEIRYNGTYTDPGQYIGTT